ncbi:unnamed protein product [Heterobilharzia americana]|nr:unnamed protein product [Heterobilharzia americana]
MFLTEICFDGVESPGSNISFQLNSTVRPSPPDNAFCCADAEGEEEGREMIAAEGADVGNNTIKNNDLNTENDVYAQFLRSLFSSVCNSTNSSPNKSNSRMTASVDTSSICERLLEKNSNDNECLSSIKHQSDSERKSSWLSNWLVQKDGNNDDEDDPDDPEFDVMAELDDIDREDFFYELRDDRAVRVSKMEAKNLHEDLRELFNSEDEHETRSRESKTPSVLTMKAYGQRLFHMDHNSRTRNSNQTEGCNSPHHIQSSVPHAIPPKDIDVPVNPIPARRRITLTGAELVRLERQLAMHIQLLATNFLLTFYWHCPTLEMAVDLISDYAGLSMLPRLPWNPYKQGVANSLTKSQSFALPIPYCLLRIMINSPIWSYACLMPTVLGPHPKSHVRLIFHPSEDALMIMGLADFSGALIRSRKIIQPKLSHQRRLSRGHGSLNKQPGRYIAYRLIGRHILPYRTLLQLRSRRWNLLANRIA